MSLEKLAAALCLAVFINGYLIVAAPRYGRALVTLVAAFGVVGAAFALTLHLLSTPHSAGSLSSQPLFYAGFGLLLVLLLAVPVNNALTLNRRNARRDEE